MKKFLLIPVIGILGALSLGAAASLGGVNAGQVGASDAVVTSCDTTGVNVGYDLEYSDAYGGFVVDEVTVSSIHPDCDGQTLHVVLTNNGDNIGEGDTEVEWFGPIVGVDTITFSVPRAPAELVNDIHVAIYD